MFYDINCINFFKNLWKKRSRWPNDFKLFSRSLYYVLSFCKISGKLNWDFSKCRKTLSQFTCTIIEISCIVYWNRKFLIKRYSIPGWIWRCFFSTYIQMLHINNLRCFMLWHYFTYFPAENYSLFEGSEAYCACQHSCGKSFHPMAKRTSTYWITCLSGSYSSEYHTTDGEPLICLMYLIICQRYT